MTAAELGIADFRTLLAHSGFTLTRLILTVSPDNILEARPV